MVAYLCGKVRRPLFQDMLRRAGVPVLTVETYDTLTLELDIGTMSRRIGNSAVDCALVYSANAAAILSKTVQATELQGRFEGTTFICISDRVSTELAGAGRKIRVAEEPNETALLNMLHRVARPAP
jgi:uroporphyrinogen-III synthase